MAGLEHRVAMSSASDFLYTFGVIDLDVKIVLLIDEFGELYHDADVIRNDFSRSSGATPANTGSIA
jgi:hypothetical protein